MYYSGSEESDLVSFFFLPFLSSLQAHFLQLSKTTVAHFSGAFARSVFLAVAP